MPHRRNKLISLTLCLLLLLEQTGFAQTVSLNLSNYLSQTPKPAVSDTFRPLHLRYLSYDNSSNNFQLLLDKGSSPPNSKPALEQVTQELLKYFFIGLSLPNDKFWVNLRPDSPDDILDDDLAKTDIGRIFLEADVQLKQDTSGLTSPQTKEGKEYWDKLYKKAGELFGSENITIPTLTRPWIVPDEVIIRESPEGAYIYKATLKVMLEEDYLKSSQLSAVGYQQYNFKDQRLKELNEYSTQLIKESIIPRLTKEINSARRYAPLRQVYYSLILAQWFKQSHQVKRSQSHQLPENPYIKLIDSGKLITPNFSLLAQQPYDKQTYFKQYQKSFQDGEYSLQEPVYTPMGQSIRRYVSGGMQIMAPISEVTHKIPARELFLQRLKQPLYTFLVALTVVWPLWSSYAGGEISEIKVHSSFVSKFPSIQVENERLIKKIINNIDGAREDNIKQAVAMLASLPIDVLSKNLRSSNLSVRYKKILIKAFAKRIEDSQEQNNEDHMRLLIDVLNGKYVDVNFELGEVSYIIDLILNKYPDITKSSLDKMLSGLGKQIYLRYPRIDVLKELFNKTNRSVVRANVLYMLFLSVGKYKEDEIEQLREYVKNKITAEELEVLTFTRWQELDNGLISLPGMFLIYEDETFKQQTKDFPLANKYLFAKAIYEESIRHQLALTKSNIGKLAPFIHKVLMGNLQRTILSNNTMLLIVANQEQRFNPVVIKEFAKQYGGVRDGNIKIFKGSKKRGENWRIIGKILNTIAHAPSDMDLAVWLSGHGSPERFYLYGEDPKDTILYSHLADAFKKRNKTKAAGAKDIFINDACFSSDNANNTVNALPGEEGLPLIISATQLGTVSFAVEDPSGGSYLLMGLKRSIGEKGMGNKMITLGDVFNAVPDIHWLSRLPANVYLDMMDGYVSDPTLEPKILSVGERFDSAAVLPRILLPLTPSDAREYHSLLQGMKANSLYAPGFPKSILFNKQNIKLAPPIRKNSPIISAQLETGINNPSVSSAAEKQTEPSDKENVGGIDLSRINKSIRAESVSSPGAEGLNSLVDVDFDLNEELIRLQQLLNAEIVPSADRLNRYARAACSSSLSSPDTKDSALSLVAVTFRLQEEKAVSAPPELKALAAWLEQGG